MPTLHDLHEVFADLEARAPQRPSRTPGCLPRPSRSPSKVGVVLAAAMVAAVVTGGAIAVRSAWPGQAGSGTQPEASALGAGADHATVLRASAVTAATSAASISAARPRPTSVANKPTAAGKPPFATAVRPLAQDPVIGFEMSAIAGYTVGAVELSDEGQSADLTATDNAAQGQVTFYVRGAFTPVVPAQPSALINAATPAYLVPMPTVTGSSSDAPAGSTVLAWQYAAGAWATVYLIDPTGTAPHHTAGASASAPTAQLLSDGVRVAAAARPHAGTFTLPFRLSAGMTVRSVDLDPNGGGAAIDWDGTTWQLGWDPTPLQAADKPSTSVSVMNGRQWIVYSRGGVEALNGIGLISTGFGLTIISAGRPLADYARFVAALTLPAGSGAPDTWFDATDALHH